MGVARYKGESVLVEWKSLPIQFRAKLVERAHHLGLLLNTAQNPNFRSLRCKGLAQDSAKDNIAFVYSMPLASDTKLLRSLRSLFGYIPRVFGYIPSVTERLGLALILTKFPKYFHTAGWLHKNLRSENALFFCLTNEILQPARLGRIQYWQGLHSRVIAPQARYRNNHPQTPSGVSTAIQRQWVSLQLLSLQPRISML